MTGKSPYNWENFKHIKIPTKLAILNAIIVTAVITFAICFYYFEGVERDRNIAYTAMYYDDLAVELYLADMPYEAVMVASSVASDFCYLYSRERRQIDFNHYVPLCDAIVNRTLLFAACADETQECPDEKIEELERILEAAEPIARELKENPPYYSVGLRYAHGLVNQYGEPMQIIPEVPLHASE